MQKREFNECRFQRKYGNRKSAAYGFAREPKVSGYS